MKLNLINQSKVKVPESFIHLWIQCLEEQVGKILFRRCEGVKKKIRNLRGKKLHLIFVNPDRMFDLNLKFRNQKKVTDVLSFSSLEASYIGEIVLCPDYIKKKSHFGFHRDLAYLILHAFLHLLGFEHEASEKKARFMYALQDEIFFKNIKSVEKKSKKNRREE